MLSSLQKQKRRASRVRYKIRSADVKKPRLSVSRSNKNISAQIIDDAKGVTVVSASTVQDMRKELGNKAANVEAAKKIGALVAERATKAGITDVVFDKGSYKYHGQVAALAEGAREAGLKF